MQLDDFIRRDLRECWIPAMGKPRRWLHDIWVDLGAPADVVRDIHERRYADPKPIGRVRRIRRGMRARAFLRRGIKRTLATG